MAPTPNPGHLPQTSEQASRSLQRFATQRVSFTFNCSRTSHLHPGAPLLPSPRPSTHKQKFKCTGMFGFDFFFYPGVVLGREGTSDPAGTVRRRREGGPGGSGAERAADPRRPPPCPASAAGSGGAHPAAAPVFTAHYFCHLASTSFQVVCRCFANFAAALSPGKRERGGKHHFVWGLLSEWGGGGGGGERQYLSPNLGGGPSVGARSDISTRIF